MKKIVIIYGGNSYEKEISIITACQAMKNIDLKKYKIYPIYLDDGFKMVKNAEKIDAYKDVQIIKNVEICNKKLYEKKRNKLKFIDDIDAALLCTHGGDGEDGTLQAFLQLNNIPYTSSSQKASVIGMYKNLTKAYLNEHKIKNVKYTYLTNLNNIDCLNEMYPCVVKPNALGSSIGVSFVKDSKDINEALQLAFMLDEQVIVEKALTSCKEYNIACIKDNSKIIQSQIEEIQSKNDYLSFDDKYMQSNDSKRIIPANINKNVERKILEISKYCYEDLQMSGVCRFDFLVDEKQRVYLNEFNTIPGSLSYYLFKGIKYKDLIDIMIENAIKDFKKEKKIFKSEILQQCNLDIKSTKFTK